MAEGGTALQGFNTLEDDIRTGNGETNSKTVEVRGLSLVTIQDVLEMYFENSRRSGGGEIEELQINDGVAYITFEEAEVVQRVVSQSPHRVAGQTLTVTLFCPPLQKPCYENRVLVQGLNSAVTEELLTNFLETETGMKVTEILYGEDERKVVVTFLNFIDFAALRKACKERRLEGTFLQVTKVTISNCIFVKNLQPFASHDVILLYFENKRRSGGGEVEKVEMNTADGYCLVYFENHDVIDSVLCQQHRIDGADIKVHLHHECLGRKSSRSRFDPFIGISEPEIEENLLKAETSSGVSSNPDQGCDFVETPKWQEDDGKNCVLPLWIKYKRASERMIIKDMRKVPCSWNFLIFWNFFTKTKQGQQLLDDILKKRGCSVTVSSDDDDLFIFEISDESFEQESEVIDFIKDALGNVYACAQQSLFSDSILIDHRMLGDMLQRVKQTKEMDSAWTELVGEQEPDAICVVCTEKNKVFILQVIASIKTAVQDCFENHEALVTIDPVWQKVLKRFGYLQEMSEEFPNLTITPDETKSVITLKGPRDQSNAAAKHVMELLGTAHAEVQEDIFSPGCQFDIFTYPEMCDYINNSIIKLPFVWIPNYQTMKIHLFSKKSEQIMGIDKFIKGCIKEKLYPLPKDQSLCCPKITKSLEELKKKHKGKIVFSQFLTGLILTSADDIFESVDAVVQEVISIETGQVQPAHVPDKCGKRDGHLINRSEDKARENQRKTEDLHSKREVKPEQNTKDPKGRKSEPNVGMDELEAMIQHETMVKLRSDGIDKIEERKKSGTKGAHTEPEEMTSEPGYMMVIGLSENTSNDNLWNFIESKMDTNLKEIVYGPRRENAVVIFERKPDHENLQNKVSKKTLDDHETLQKKVSKKTLDSKVLEVYNMPPPTSIMVSTKEPKEFSTDTLTFHFESKKFGSAELVADGIKIIEDGWYIMTFTDSDAVKRVCTMKHTVEKTPLNVSPYYEYKKWAAWNTAIHGINIPAPFEHQVDPILLKYLQAFPRAMKAMQIAMVEINARIDLKENAVLVTCLLNTEVKGCRKLVISWRKDAEEHWNKFLASTFQIKKISNLSDIWKDCMDIVESMIKGKDIMLVKEKSEHYIHLVGFYEEVKITHGEVMGKKEKLERIRRIGKETMPLKSAAKKRLLDRDGIFQRLRAQFCDFDVFFEQSSEEIVLSGVPDDRNIAKLQIYKELRKFYEPVVIHDSTVYFSDLLRKVPQEISLLKRWKKMVL